MILNESVYRSCTKMLKEVLGMLRRALCGILTMVLVFVLFGCNKSSKNIVPITIKAEECYSISDVNELDAVLSNSYVSSDRSIAVLRDGKYIYGLKEGQTKITVTCDGVDTVYDVTVLPVDNTLSPVKNENRGVDIPANDIHIGCGYNALSGEEFNELTVKEPIFDWKQVYSSGNLYMDESLVGTCECYSGVSASEFIDSISKKTTYHTTVKLFGLKLYDKVREKCTQDSSTKSKVSGIYEFYTAKRYVSYYFLEDDNEFYDYLSDNVKNALLGTDGTTVADFINKYGTHVITSGNYGRSFQYDFVMSDSENCILGGYNPSPKRLYKEFENCLKMDYASAKEYVDEMHPLIDCEYFYPELNNYDSLEIFLGNRYFNYEQSGVSFDRALLDMVENWHIPGLEIADESINNGFGSLDDICVLIGPRNEQSLYPVWQLIPTDDELGVKRKNEFIQYVKAHSKK